ncbi:MAG: penicillin-binding transpeptidase domain-containing protein [Solirubrobacteraceae bacterium]
MHRSRARRRSRRLLTHGLPLVLIAAGALVLGWYLAGAGARAEHRLVVNYTSAWQHHDYAEMYALLSPGATRRMSLRRFSTRLERTAQTATETSLRPLRVISIAGGWARVRCAVSTRVFGTLREVLRMPLSGSGGGARVRFGNSLLFPGLAASGRLRRRALLGARGTLLASDGQVLAAGSSLHTSIPVVAGEIVGTLGPIPPARASWYAMRGFPRDAQVGQDGLEAIFQRRLAGRPGGQLEAGRRLLASVPPRAGAAVRTTIDPDLEQDAIDAIAGHYAGITVLNPHNGDIEAAAGLAFTALQPPGSTFKIITVSAALSDGVATPQTEYPEVSQVTIDGFKLHNAAGEVCGGTLQNAFAVSCDTTFAPLGDQIGATRLVAMARSFGFDRPTGIATALESTIPSAAAIGGPVALGASAIGQGLVQASTLEMADAGATIANGGLRPVPTMNQSARPRYVRAVSPTVAAEVQTMMEAVVSYGTGTSAQIPGVTVAGKTGTAELANTAGKRNDARETDAWFVGYAPVPDPKVVVCALFPNAGYGAQAAAPAVKEVLEDALGMTP